MNEGEGFFFCFYIKRKEISADKYQFAKWELEVFFVIPLLCSSVFEGRFHEFFSLYRSAGETSFRLRPERKNNPEREVKRGELWNTSTTTRTFHLKMKKKKKKKEVSDRSQRRFRRLPGKKERKNVSPNLLTLFVQFEESGCRRGNAEGTDNGIIC